MNKIFDFLLVFITNYYIKSNLQPISYNYKLQFSSLILLILEKRNFKNMLAKNNKYNIEIEKVP